MNSTYAGAQAYIFLCTVAGGVIIAFIFDLFRIRRKAFKAGNLFTYFEDLLFWIIVAVVMFTTVYYSNEGELRSYAFIGTLLGIILYALLLSRLVMNSSLFIINTTAKIIKVVFFLITYPFRILFKLLSIPAHIIARFTRKSFRSVRRAGKNRFLKAVTWRRIVRNIRKKI